MTCEQVREAYPQMESKDGVHAAFRQWNSAQCSPHRTSNFHHIRRSNSGCVSAFSHHTLSFGYDSILLSLWFSDARNVLDPFALRPALPASLGGRDSTDYYGSAAPTKALATSPPILYIGSFV